MAVDILIKLVLHIAGVFMSMCALVIRFLSRFLPRNTFYKDLKKEIILITGGGNGLGRSLAILFSRLGARVVVWDIDDRGMRQTQRLVVRKGGECHCYECDVTNREMVYTQAKRVKDQVGAVTILINNAGFVMGKTLLELPDLQIEKTFGVNALSHFWTCKAFLPEMQSAKRGHIVSVASIAGLFGNRKLTDYCSSKAAAIVFYESLSLELKADKCSYIQTTLIMPFLFSSGTFTGVKSIIPVMDVERVARRVMDAVLFNEDVVVIPDNLSFYPLFKTMTPWNIYCFLNKVFKGDSAMDAFVKTQRN